MLEQHGLTAAIFDAVKALLVQKQLLLTAGTIVDATIIAAPTSTKNAMQTRDPEMRQTRKGNAWHFGMKLPIGNDLKGRVHTVTATDAAQADITQLPHLLHGEETVVYGDQAYWKEADRRAYEARGVRYRMNRRPPRSPAPDGPPAGHQSRAVADSRSWRTPAARREATLGLRDGALSRAREESRTRLDLVCPRESLLGAPPAVAGVGEVRVVTAATGTPRGRSRQPAGPRSAMPLSAHSIS